MPGEFAGPVKISLARGSGRAVAQGFSQGVLGKGAMKGSWNKKYIDIGKDEPKLAEQVTQGSSKNWYQLFAEWLRSHSPFGK